MERTIRLRLGDGYIHFMIEQAYLGMLVFDKGELSDFRAIIRRNRLEVSDQTLRKTLEVCLYELLNQYLSEVEYLSSDKLQRIKTDIVKSNIDVLDKIGQSILHKKVLAK